jgi:diguanylate cyclase (GGDEF)-like protein
MFEGSSRNILGGYRDHIMQRTGLAASVFVAPFGVNNFVHGRVLLGVAISAMVAIFVINGVAVHFKKRPPIPFGLLLAPMYASLLLSIAQQGTLGMLWCYPAALFAFFILPRLFAVASGAVLTIAATPLVYQAAGTDVALRFAVSMLLTAIVMHIITGVMSRLQEELEDLAATDPLTGALNRRQMETSLSEAVERRSRSNASASVLLIDIDHFKNINDSFGHDAGDKVLKALVALVKKRARRLDRVFRMGGEEFLVLLSDTRAPDAVIHAERLRLLVSDAPLVDTLSITISIGVAECVPGQAVDAWIKQADDALYFAKQDGRNRVVCETPAAVTEPDVEIMGTDRRTRER